MSRIRPLAICLFRHENKILVALGSDPVKRQEFYRPLGGGIEFGEFASDTLRREMREELNAEICDLRYLFTLENIFTFNGAAGHEIVLVFDGAFVKRALYEQPVLRGHDTGESFDACWKSMRELQNDARPLYPDGLLERLMRL